MTIRSFVVAILLANMLGSSFVTAEEPAQSLVPLADLRARIESLERENHLLKKTVFQHLPNLEVEAPSPSDYVSIPEPTTSANETHIRSIVEDYLQQRVSEFTLGATLATASAVEATFEQRLAAIEAERKKELEAIVKKKADDATKPTLKWTGRVHTDYWAFPSTSPGANAFETGDADLDVQDRFLFRRLRIGIQGTIPDNMLYKLEVDFNNPSLPQLKDNYIGWEELPWLQTVLVGNQKRPYGLDHLNSSRYNVFLERPDIIEAFNQDARRFGMCSYGQSDDLAFNWRYGAYMSQDIQNLGVVLATPVLGDYQAEFAGRLANTYWYDEASGGRSYAHWGISGATASTDPSGVETSTARFQSRVEARTSRRWLDTGVIDGADHYELMGVEGVINIGPLQCVAEYQRVWMHRQAGDPDLQFQGCYVYASYFLTGEHMAWDRKTGQLDRVQPFENFFCVDTQCDGVQGGWGAWQVAARYSHADLSDEDIDGGVANELTLALNWYWNPYAKMQFNAIYGEITDRRPADGQTDAYFTILGTRFIVDF